MIMAQNQDFETIQRTDTVLLERTDTTSELDIPFTNQNLPAFVIKEFKVSGNGKKLTERQNQTKIGKLQLDQKISPLEKHH